MMPNVLFDLDGTLINPREGITRCLQHALRCFDRPPPSEEALLSFIGPPLRKSFRFLLDTESPELIELAVSHYRDRYARHGLFEAEPYPGIREVLSDLHDGGLRLLLVTGKPKVYADRLAEHFGLTRFLAAVFGPELDGHLDDKTELVRHVTEVCRLSPKRTLMVGDRREDIMAGRANGMGTMGVLYGYGSFAELSEAAPDGLCEAPGDLYGSIRSYFNEDPG